MQANLVPKYPSITYMRQKPYSLRSSVSASRFMYVRDAMTFTRWHFQASRYYSYRLNYGPCRLQVIHNMPLSTNQT